MSILQSELRVRCGTGRRHLSPSRERRRPAGSPRCHRCSTRRRDVGAPRTCIPVQVDKRSWWLCQVLSDCDQEMQKLKLAERGGFEPPIPFGYSRFPGVRIKPLCHLSAGTGTLANRAAPRNHFSTHPSPVKLDTVLKLGTGKSPELADKNVHARSAGFPAASDPSSGIHFKNCAKLHIVPATCRRPAGQVKSPR
jgi:hypothetical protein